MSGGFQIENEGQSQSYSQFFQSEGFHFAVGNFPQQEQGGTSANDIVMSRPPLVVGLQSSQNNVSRPYPREDLYNTLSSRGYSPREEDYRSNSNEWLRATLENELRAQARSGFRDSPDIVLSRWQARLRVSRANELWHKHLNESRKSLPSSPTDLMMTEEEQDALKNPGCRTVNTVNIERRTVSFDEDRNSFHLYSMSSDSETSDIPINNAHHPAAVMTDVSPAAPPSSINQTADPEGDGTTNAGSSSAKNYLDYCGDIHGIEGLSEDYSHTKTNEEKQLEFFGAAEDSAEAPLGAFSRFSSQALRNCVPNFDPDKLLFRLGDTKHLETPKSSPSNTDAKSETREKSEEEKDSRITTNPTTDQIMPKSLDDDEREDRHDTTNATRRMVSASPSYMSTTTTMSPHFGGGSGGEDELESTKSHLVAHKVQEEDMMMSQKQGAAYTPPLVPRGAWFDNGSRRKNRSDEMTSIVKLIDLPLPRKYHHRRGTTHNRRATTDDDAVLQSASTVLQARRLQNRYGTSPMLNLDTRKSLVRRNSTPPETGYNEETLSSSSPANAALLATNQLNASFEEVFARLKKETDLRRRRHRRSSILNDYHRIETSTKRDNATTTAAPAAVLGLPPVERVGKLSLTPPPACSNAGRRRVITPPPPTTMTRRSRFSTSVVTPQLSSEEKRRRELRERLMESARFDESDGFTPRELMSSREMTKPVQISDEDYAFIDNYERQREHKTAAAAADYVSRRMDKNWRMTKLSYPEKPAVPRPMVTHSVRSKNRKPEPERPTTASPTIIARGRDIGIKMDGSSRRIIINDNNENVGSPNSAYPRSPRATRASQLRMAKCRNEAMTRALKEKQMDSPAMQHRPGSIPGFLRGKVSTKLLCTDDNHRLRRTASHSPKSPLPTESPPPPTCGNLRRQQVPPSILESRVVSSSTKFARVPVQEFHYDAKSRRLEDRTPSSINSSSSITTTSNRLDDKKKPQPSPLILQTRRPSPPKTRRPISQHQNPSSPAGIQTRCGLPPRTRASSSPPAFSLPFIHIGGATNSKKKTASERKTVTFENHKTMRRSQSSPLKSDDVMISSPQVQLVPKLHLHHGDHKELMPAATIPKRRNSTTIMTQQQQQPQTITTTKKIITQSPSPSRFDDTTRSSSPVKKPTTRDLMPLAGRTLTTSAIHNTPSPAHNTPSPAHHPMLLPTMRPRWNTPSSVVSRTPTTTHTRRPSPFLLSSAPRIQTTSSSGNRLLWGGETTTNRKFSSPWGGPMSPKPIEIPTTTTTGGGPAKLFRHFFNW